MQVGFEVIVGWDRESEFRLFLPRGSSTAKTSMVTFAEDSAAGIAVVLMGRLFYRQELKNRLPKGSVREFSSDAALVLNIFCNYGIESLKWLEGEFAIVLLDQKQRRVFAFRDPLGSWPLYWTSVDSTLILGTSLLLLSQRLSDASLNLDFMASFLMTSYAFAELHSEQTAFKGIDRILPGTLVRINPEGQTSKLWTWDWMSQVPDLGDITLKEAGVKFSNLLQQAVKERLEDEIIAAHLSGGMDSSSVVCLASQQLASEESSKRLHTLSLVYDLSSLAGEKEYIEMILQQGGAIEPHYLDGDSALDFQWFTEDIPLHDEPYAGLFRLALEKLLVDSAHQLRATTILTGVGVEELFDGKRLHIADFLSQGHWFTALKEARRWAKAGNTSLWSALYRYGIEPILPPLLHDGIGSLMRRGYGSWPKLGLFSIPPWILPEFAHEQQMWNKGLDMVRKVYSQPIEQSNNIWSLQAAAGNWASWYIAAPKGIHSSHPLLDLRLINFCMALPRDIRQIPGIKKPILQTAMDGILPEPIRTRRWKRSFNEVYWLGLSNNLSHLEDMVWKSRIDELAIFDKEKLIQAMRQHALGIGAVMAGGRINSSLALIAWFDQIERTLKKPIDLATSELSVF